MSLEELERAFRERQRLSGEPQVIISMHIAESDIRVLKPRLEADGSSLSEHVRALTRASAK